MHRNIFSFLSLNTWGLLPVYIIMTMFAVLPILIMIYASFMTSGSYGGIEHVFSMESYQQILFREDWDENLEFYPVYLIGIIRSIILAVSVASISVLVGFPVAYFISRQPQTVKIIMLYFVTLPFWISMVIRVYGWIIILQDNGVLEKTLVFFRLVENTDTFLYTNIATGIGMIYSYIPLVILPIYASIEKLDKSIIEAAHDLYSNKIKTLWYVILPLTKPGILAGFVLVLVPSLGTILEPMLLGGGKKIMLGNLIRMQFGFARNWSFGASLAVVLLAITVVVILINARKKAMEE